MGATNDFCTKKSRKINQNLTNFFFQKIKHKKNSENQFHLKRLKTRNFGYITARHEKSAMPEVNNRRNCHKNCRAISQSPKI